MAFELTQDEDEVEEELEQSDALLALGLRLAHSWTTRLRSSATIAGTISWRSPITGAAAVAAQVLSRGTRFAPHARPAFVNGAPGAIVGPPGRPFAVVGFTVARGRIVAIDLIIDPDKLRGLALLNDKS